jgi:hypothetical protein
MITITKGIEPFLKYGSANGYLSHEGLGMDVPGIVAFFVAGTAVTNLTS